MQREGVETKCVIVFERITCPRNRDSLEAYPFFVKVILTTQEVGPPTIQSEALVWGGFGFGLVGVW